jgi:23S rRNA (uracil1939-C5)-methyltransferase
VCHSPDGRAVFVPFTAPGDRVRVRVQERRPRFLRACVDALLEPGASRTDPVCSAFGSCGGCAWQHVEHRAQRAAKARIVADALERLAGLPPPGPVRIEASPMAYGYRSRTRVLREGGRVGYRRRRSHALCPVSRCPVLAPPLEGALRALAQAPRDGGRREEWELALGAGPPRAALLSGDAPAAGAPIALRVGGDRLQVSPGVFFQSNGLLHDALARAVAQAAGRGQHALELFAGAGFLTLGLARQFDRVTAVEAHPTAARDLRHNLRAARLGHVEVVAARLPEALERPPLAEGRPDVAVLDPPRSGLPPGAAHLLRDLAPRRLVYLSCDPATLARDVRTFADQGYALASVDAFDLFPQTPHVEVLAVLEAGPRGR